MTLVQKTVIFVTKEIVLLLDWIRKLPKARTFDRILSNTMCQTNHHCLITVGLTNPAQKMRVGQQKEIRRSERK